MIRRRWRPTVGRVPSGTPRCWPCCSEAACRPSGVDLTLPLLVAGLAADRVLTLLPITPGGVGVVEGGTALVLTRSGAAPAPVVSGVLLYRAFTYFAEIPVGGLSAMVWTLGAPPARTPHDGPLPGRAGDGLPMRILHVCDSYLPQLGGIELHVDDLAARQRAERGTSRWRR